RCCRWCRRSASRSPAASFPTSDRAPARHPVPRTPARRAGTLPRRRSAPPTRAGTCGSCSSAESSAAPPTGSAPVHTSTRRCTRPSGVPPLLGEQESTAAPPGASPALDPLAGPVPASPRKGAPMILIGQYDSPFVRRVGIALVLYGLAFEHRPWSTFADADKIRPYNPLTRVPALVLDDGDVLVESHSILDYLDGRVGPERALFPAVAPARHRALKIAALATGIADKAVSLFYERRLHDKASNVWLDRCRLQIGGAL